jgi:AcrR family transcriptional regulator
MTDMKPSKLAAKDRKAQILAAARSLFAKEGYAEVTLDDIARKVGVSRPRITKWQSRMADCLHVT